MPIGDSTPTSRWPRTGPFVRTCRRTVLQYVENKVPLALKWSVAAHRFPNKICFNEGYLYGPKVCRSNLETPCITTRIVWLMKTTAMYKGKHRFLSSSRPGFDLLSGKFCTWGFFGFYPQLSPQPSMDIIGNHNHQKHFMRSRFRTFKCGRTPPVKMNMVVALQELSQLQKASTKCMI